MARAAVRGDFGQGVPRVSRQTQVALLVADVALLPGLAQEEALPPLPQAPEEAARDQVQEGRPLRDVRHLHRGLCGGGQAAHAALLAR